MDHLVFIELVFCFVCLDRHSSEVVVQFSTHSSLSSSVVNEFAPISSSHHQRISATVYSTRTIYQIRQKILIGLNNQRLAAAILTIFTLLTEQYLDLKLESPLFSFVMPNTLILKHFITLTLIHSKVLLTICFY